MLRVRRRDIGHASSPAVWDGSPRRSSAATVAGSPSPPNPVARVAAASTSSTSVSYDGLPRRLAAPSDDTVENVAFSPDGRWLVAAFGSAIYDRSNRVVVLWHLTSPQRRHWILRGHTRFVEELAFSFDGRWLVTQSGDSFSGAFTTRLWDLTAADPSSSVRALAGGDAGRGSGGLVIDSR